MQVVVDGLRRSHNTMLATSASDRATWSVEVTVGGGDSIATRIARIPRARAGSMSLASESPIMMQSRAGTSPSLRAASKNLVCGLRHPTSSEVR